MKRSAFAIPGVMFTHAPATKDLREFGGAVERRQLFTKRQQAMEFAQRVRPDVYALSQRKPRSATIDKRTASLLAVSQLADAALW